MVYDFAGIVCGDTAYEHSVSVCLECGRIELHYKRVALDIPSSSDTIGEYTGPDGAHQTGAVIAQLHHRLGLGELGVIVGAYYLLGLLGEF